MPLEPKTPADPRLAFRNTIESSLITYKRERALTARRARRQRELARQQKTTKEAA